MASFTEQATLRVVDQSSAQLRKINAELKKLFATANRLKSIRVDLKVNVGNLQAVNRQINQLVQSLNRLHSRSVNFRVNLQGGTAATQQLSRLQAQAARGINVRMNYTGHPPSMGGGGGRGGGGPGAYFDPPDWWRRRYPYGRTPGRAALGGVGGGFGIGLGRLNESFGEVALAGYFAARALKAVGEAAYNRDRAQLAVDTQTSEAQRQVFKQMDAEAKARGDLPPALRYKKDQFDLARSSFLGDVGNSDIFKTPEQLKSIAAQQERAQRADILARTLYKDFVPGLYARDPTLTQEGAQEQLKQLSQALGTMTSTVFEKNALGQQVLSADAQRVLKGIELGLRAAPELTLRDVKTMAASIKSLGYTATPQQIAEVLYNVSARGQRAAGEAYQMYRAGQGSVDIAKLNKAIFDLGGFIEGTAEPTKKGIKAGTGIPVEFPDPDDPSRTIKLGERPSEWWRQLFRQPAAQKKLADDVAKQAAGALGAGATDQQKKAAADAARARVLKGEDTAQERADFINRTLAGARNTALQAILDAWLGGGIAKAGIGQAETQPGPDEIAKRMGESWAVQLRNLGTETSNAAASLGELAANAIGLSGILKGMADFVAANPMASGAIALGLGGAFTAALIAPMATLAAAGSGLSGAAAALTQAAFVLSGGKIVGPAAGAAAGAATQTAAASTVATVARQALRVLGPVGFLLGMTEEAGGASNIPSLEAVKNALDANYKATLQLRKTQADLAAAQATNQPAEKIAALQATIDSLKATIEGTKIVIAGSQTGVTSAADRITKQIGDNLQLIKLPPPQLPPDWKPLPPQVKPWPQPGEAVPPIPFTNFVPDLIAAGNNFQTIFSTGATQIGGAGQTAADTLTLAAPSIGNAIGNAAANAIKAATANISVNVTPQETSAPRGAQKPE